MCFQDQDEAAQLQRQADRITNLILHSDLPKIDIDIQIDNLRFWCKTLLPEKVDLFDRIYVSRFRRLWEQFRLAVS